MYLPLILVLGNMLSVVLPAMSSDRVVMEQSLDGDRSVKAQAELLNELKVAQQPSTSPLNKELRDLLFNKQPREVLELACQIRQVLSGGAHLLVCL